MKKVKEYLFCSIKRKLLLITALALIIPLIISSIFVTLNVVRDLNANANDIAAIMTKEVNSVQKGFSVTEVKVTSIVNGLTSEAGIAVADLLSLALVEPIVGKNFLTITNYLKAASSSKRIAFAVYVNAKGRYIPRRIKSDDPSLQILLKDNNNKKRKLKDVVALANQNSSFLIIEKPVIFDGAAIGKVIVCINMTESNRTILDMKGVFNKLSKNMKDNFDGLLKKITISFDKSSIKVKGMQLVSVIIVMLTVLGLVYLTITIILKRLGSLTTMLREISEGEGDLTKRLDESGSDELAEVAQYFNMFVKNIQEIIRSVKQDSEEMSSGSTMLNVSTGELALTFSDQSSQITGIASAMEQMSVTSDEVMRSIQAVIERAGKAKEKTSDSKLKLDDAVTNIETIRDAASELAQTIENLSNSSVEIGEILIAINEIADQTNLLALNAAIEAARAGEAGRGFAVVADEIRKLAERTQSSTLQIEKIISNLQNETQIASEKMEIAERNVEGGTAAIEEVDSMFGEIVNAVEEIDAANTTIGTAVDEQVQTIVSVNENVQSISSGVSESSASIDEFSITAEDLKSKADNLKKLVDRFKTD